MSDALPNVGAAVVGIVLAFLVSLFIVSNANATPEAVDQPLVTYGER